jgi:methylmalonyl-CoA mutase cobalamin-binding domain/chain
MTLAEKEELIKKIKDAILTYKKDEVIELAKKGVEIGISQVDLIQNALTPAIQEIGDKFGSGELPLPYLMLGAETMQGGLDYLIQSMPKGTYKPKATMVLGSVTGDIHDLGISIVAAVFEAAGIHVINLGRDVPTDKFIDTAEQEGAEIIGTSALLSGTMFQQKVVLEAIKKRGLRDKYIYMIGGGAMPSGAWCDEIGADGWATDVMTALTAAKELLASKKGIEID